MDVLSVNSRKMEDLLKLRKIKWGGAGEFWPAEMLHSEDTNNCTYYIRSLPKSAVDPVQKVLGLFLLT